MSFIGKYSFDDFSHSPGKKKSKRFFLKKGVIDKVTKPSMKSSTERIPSRNELLIQFYKSPETTG